MKRINFECSAEVLEDRIAEIDKAMPGLAAAIKASNDNWKNDYGNFTRANPRDIAFTKTGLFKLAVSKWVTKDYTRGEGGIEYSEYLRLYFEANDNKLDSLKTEVIITRDKYNEQKDYHLGYDCSGAGIRVLSETEVLAFWRFLDDRQSLAPAYLFDIKNNNVTRSGWKPD